MKKFIIIALFIITIPKLFSQDSNIKFEPLPLETGLNQHEFYSVMQDHKGFIWMGGPRGLYKYNGYVLSHVSDQPECNNCSFGYTAKIIEDSLGLLWLSTSTGIRIYDPEKERSMLVYQPVDEQIGTAMILDTHANIWTSGYSKICKISYRKKLNIPVTKDAIFKYGAKYFFKTETFQLPFQKGSKENYVISINKDEQGNIWAGCTGGLYFLKRDHQHFTRLDEELQKGIQQRLKNVYKILPIDENSLWILESKGLYLITNVRAALKDSNLNTSGLVFSLEMKDGITINNLLVDRNGNFFVKLDDKFYLIKKENISDRISFELIGKSEYYPWDLFEDQSGVIWLTQADNGVSKFKMSQLIFIDYGNYKELHSRNFVVNSIFRDSINSIWTLVNFKAIFKIQPNNNKIKIFKPDQIEALYCFIPSFSQKSLWIGSNNGILEFNLKTGYFRDPLPHTRIADSLRHSTIIEILDDGKQLFAATYSGLFVFNYENRRVYFATFRNPNPICSLIKLRNGEIWAGGAYYGIHKVVFNSKTDNFSLEPVVFKNRLIDADIGISTDYLLYQDTNGIIWIGNETGIHSINPINGESKNYNIFEDTDYREVKSIIADDQNNLWLGTHKNLCRIDIISGKVKVFVEEDGVPFAEYYRNSVFKDKEGRIYFGGNKGFYSFHPDSFKTNDFIPPIVITDLKLFNNSVNVNSSRDAILKKNISYTDSIYLKYNQNNLSFEFASLDYNQPSKNKYAHKLEGYDKEWIYTNANNRIASYANLKPGTYVFKVKGSNNQEIWNEKATSLVIRIHKPWWATFFSYSIYLIGAFSILFSYIRWRLWKLKREKLELERQVVLRTHLIEDQKEEILAQRDRLEEQNQQIAEQEQLKSRFFANVSHEFRTPLSLIQNPVEELLDDPRRNEKERRKLNMVQRNVRRLLNLVNQLLDISKLDGSKMKLELAEADVMNHLRAITGAFTSLAETKSIQYGCRFPKDELKTWFDPDKLEKIASNLLSNAFKFTPEGGEIIFMARYKNSDDIRIDRMLEFSVKDTGPGIPAQSLEKIFDRFYQVEESLKSEGGGTGIGLSLARDMVNLLHGNIVVESEQHNGSTFTVSFPLGKNHLNESEFILLKEAPESAFSVSGFYENVDKEIPVQEGISADKKPVILIVEDNRDIRMQLTDNFIREYAISEAVDGVAGLKKATEMIPDLVITDLMMPRMDGVDLCQKLKNDERTSHIPIIMLTAKVTLEDRITGYQTGADDYISKPFHMAELKARVSNLIEQHRKIRERFGREVTLQPGEISITPLDEKFLNRAIEVIENHLDEESFDLSEFRSAMNITRSTLFRKLQALTNQSPTEFIRTIRLKRAASLLKQHFGNITQVSLEVGFNNLSYFNRSFKKLFGVSPHEYAKMN